MKAPQWPKPPIKIEALGSLVAIEKSRPYREYGNDYARVGPWVTTFAFEYGGGIGLDTYRVYLTLDPKSYANLRGHFLREILIDAIEKENWK